MKHRKLRIAWSLVWGSVAALLVALWVRSYWVADFIGYQEKWSQASVESASGRISFKQEYSDTPIVGDDAWYIESTRRTPGDDELTQQFEWWEFGSDIEVKIPSWLPTIVLAALAVSPWFRWRFTLRTLVIATALVAVGLGLIVWAMRG
jgi:hypothetical protein